MTTNQYKNQKARKNTTVTSISKQQPCFFIARILFSLDSSLAGRDSVLASVVH